MIQVEFSVDQDVVAVWDEPRITALIQRLVASELDSRADYGVDIHLVGDEEIRGLNAQHRGIDAATDVLSFPLHSAECGFVNPPGEPVQLGDVVVSYPRAVQQAEEYGHSVERELAYLVAHGVLHILGYDHEVEADQQRMRQREEEALQPLGFTR